MKMKKTLLLTIALNLILVFANAQTITVLDSEDHKPVKDVAIFNNSRTRFGYTDLAGEFNIAAFSDDDILNFQHPSYENIALSRKEIEAMDSVVILNHRTFEIDEFVVSANRWEQNKEEVPNKITQIRMPTINFMNPQTSADLLGISDEVFIQKSQLGGGSPMIRGFATNRILLVVDGIRMNNAIFREGNLQNVISIDPNIIETTEVIFGPGATMYGSDAIGGVMDFHTKKALLSTSDKPNIRVNAMLRSSTANSEKTGHIDMNLGGKKIAFMSSLTYASYGDLRMGTVGNPGYRRPEFVKRVNGTDVIVDNPDPNLQVFSGYDQFNLTGKLRFQPTEKLNIVLTSTWSATSDYPRYDRLIQYRNGELRYGDWYYGPQKWNQNSVTMEYKPGSGLFDALRVVVARQDFEESRNDRKIYDPVLNNTTDMVVAYSLNADFEKTLGNGLLYYGIEGVSNDITSTAAATNIETGVVSSVPTRYPDGVNRYLSGALYSGFKVNISDRIVLNSGLRYNYVSLHSTFIDNPYSFPFTELNFSNDALTGSVGFVFLPGDNTQINLNGSTGFRAPNLDDAGKVFDSEPGNVVVPNPGLKPEYAYNFDFGVSHDFLSIVHLEMTGFVTKLKNAMVRRDFSFNGQDSIMYLGELSKVLALVNTGSATVFGGHAALQVSPAKYFRIKANVNITRGFDQDGIPLRHVAPLFGSAHFIYENKKIRADFYMVGNGAMTNDMMAPSETDKAYLYATDANGDPWCPPWYTINLKASYQVGTLGIITAGVENILDHRYRPYSSGIVAPGRNFIIALRVML